MEMKRKKNLKNNKFTQNLKLESEGLFETPTLEQIIDMMNEMGYYPPLLSVISRHPNYILYGGFFYLE